MDAGSSVVSAVCPNGHSSTAEDYCDVCGVPIAAAASPTEPLPALASEALACPNCGTENVAEALFCEACGYDFTTGTMPRSAAPEPPDAGPAPPDQAGQDQAGQIAPTEETVADQPVAARGLASGEAPEDRATPAQPTPAASPAAFSWVAEVWVDPSWYAEQQSPDPLPSPGLPTVVPLRHTSILVGRTSRSRGIHPDIDCEPDSGASRRQAQLTTDGQRWWVEDLDSANGTFVGDASGPLPSDPIAVGSKHELDAGDRVYVGAWTRLVIRRATDDEVATLP
jgi:hypothetical protein